MGKYFNKFPQIQYGNTITLNILARVAAANTLLSNFNVFYPYTMKEGERVDSVAFNYYDDPEFDFLIYIVNNIIDPFFGVYLSDTDFNNYIVDKYGSIANATQTPVYYKNDWADDPSVLSQSGYDALPAANKKYWNPIVDQDNQTVSYQRKPADWIIDTNQVLTVNITLNGNTQFQIGEPVTNSNNGTGFVVFANSSLLNVQHISGSWPNSAVTVSGNYSNASANVAPNSVTIVAQNVTNDELAYYAPVSYYDFESQLNAANKEIQLLDKQYLGPFYKQFQQLMAS